MHSSLADQACSVLLTWEKLRETHCFFLLTFHSEACSNVALILFGKSSHGVLIECVLIEKSVKVNRFKKVAVFLF